MSKKPKLPRQRHQAPTPPNNPESAKVELAGIGVRLAAVIYDGDRVVGSSTICETA